MTHIRQLKNNLIAVLDKLPNRWFIFNYFKRYLEGDTCVESFEALLECLPKLVTTNFKWHQIPVGGYQVKESSILVSADELAGCSLVKGIRICGDSDDEKKFRINCTISELGGECLIAFPGKNKPWMRLTTDSNGKWWAHSTDTYPSHEIWGDTIIEPQLITKDYQLSNFRVNKINAVLAGFDPAQWDRKANYDFKLSNLSLNDILETKADPDTAIMLYRLLLITVGE